MINGMDFSCWTAILLSGILSVSAVLKMMMKEVLRVSHPDYGYVYDLPPAIKEYLAEIQRKAGK